MSSTERKASQDEVVILARGMEERIGYMVSAAEVGERITVDAYRRDLNDALDAIQSIQERLPYGRSDRRPLAAKTAPLGAHKLYG